ncbi:natural killer cell receptor 2B4-like [Alligator mississippiensis]|uniref:natural killer cell receptor 2B4-like n=1 Tax=Alligator mississippiensis TaxID=8496 RepID=UPI0028778F14|nr:natural killer cell receptor 2B4-like [Alligator mississippiensis]
MPLVPENQLSGWEEITWRVRLSSRKMYSIVTFSSSDSVVDINIASPLGRRIAFHPGNLSLQIKLVKKSDSGVYSMDAISASGRLDTTCFHVPVFDQVRQPNLTALSAHSELGKCNVTLSCHVPAADRATYSWSRGASWSPAREDQQLPGHQSQLQLEITAGSNNTFYHCKASNAASWGTATIHVKPLCNFPATGRNTASSTLWLAADSAVTLGIFLLLHNLQSGPIQGQISQRKKDSDPIQRLIEMDEGLAGLLESFQLSLPTWMPVGDPAAPVAGR